MSVLVIFLQGGVTALHIASYNNMLESVKAILTSASRAEETINIQDDVSKLSGKTMISQL